MGRQSRSSAARYKARSRRGASALNEKMYNERPFPSGGIGYGYVDTYIPTLYGCIIRKAGTNTIGARGYTHATSIAGLSS